MVYLPTGITCGVKSVAAELEWKSVCHLLRERGRTAARQELFRFEGTSATFREIECRSNRLANALCGCGVGMGDRIALVLPNGLEFPVTWMAAAKTGAIVVPVNVGCRGTDLTYILRDCGARFAVACANGVEVIQRVQPQCPALQQIGVLAGAAQVPKGVVDLQSEMESSSEEFNIEHLQADDVLAIQYTSGTTGLPKGCILTHKYWLELARSIQQYVNLSEKDIVLTAQPFYYMDPIWNMVLCLLASVPLVILPKFSPSTFWRSVRDHRVTFFYCLATMPVYLFKQPEDPDLERGQSVRLVLCSGIPASLHRAFEKRWNCPWRETYGTTELGCVLMMSFDDHEWVGSGAMGKPVEGREVKVIALDGSELPDGHVGQLLVRGGTIMLGYYNKPEATSEYIREGWAHTGDMAFRDAHGYYHLVGRIKDTIRRSGENISAAEVEGVLCEHPRVKSAACIPVLDEIRGEEVKACVLLQPGETPRSVPPEELVEFTRYRLAAFKVPRYLEYVESFPLTASGRIAKARLRIERSNQTTETYDALLGRWS
jgi:acyl-CoA synthetase (AMP-forming)/AMP-acid ligase II